MEEEGRRDPQSMVAAYSLVVAARGMGAVARAWNAAIAPWVRAPRATPRPPQPRADPEPYMNTVVIPEQSPRSTLP